MSTTLSPALFVASVAPAQIDGAVSSASGFSYRLSSTLRRMRLASDLRDLTKNLQVLLDMCAKAATNAEGSATATVTADEIDHALRSFEYLEMIIGRTVTTLRKHGFGNDSKTAAGVIRLEKQLEEMSDIVDWFQLAIRSGTDALSQLFNESRQEFETGESYTMDEVF